MLLTQDQRNLKAACEGRAETAVSDRRRHQEYPVSESDDRDETDMPNASAKDRSADEDEAAYSSNKPAIRRRRRNAGIAPALNNGRPTVRKVSDEANTGVRGSNSTKRLRKLPKANPLPSDDSLLSDVAADGWQLIKLSFRLPRKLYPLWRWPVLGYLVWLMGSYLFVFLYNHTMALVVNTVCPIRYIGPMLPLCTETRVPAADVAKLGASQEHLVIVMEQVGQGFDLARDMTGHEFAVRDLKIRVAASNLKRREELTRELHSLIQHTQKASKHLSRFTAKVGKSIDSAKAFDDYAVKGLGYITKELQNAQTLPRRALSAIAPFAAFGPARETYHEDEIKQLLLTTATRISSKVKLLIDDSFELSHNLYVIQEILDRIQEIATDEIGDLPRRDVLSSLWEQLARPDDHAQMKSHKELLTDMAMFYESSSSVVRGATVALNQVEAELNEFRDDFATPELVLKDYPLEVSIKLLRLASERLESGRLKLSYVEQGSKPQLGGTQSITTMTVTVSQASEPSR